MNSLIEKPDKNKIQTFSISGIDLGPIQINPSAGDGEWETGRRFFCLTKFMVRCSLK